MQRAHLQSLPIPFMCALLPVSTALLPPSRLGHHREPHETRRLINPFRPFNSCQQHLLQFPRSSLTPSQELLCRERRLSV
ncbi:hypothetical protein QBC32DRAFT_338277 [Pseudoneurospora amorphoporcata]|uniref:Secreted protein n=1 Tax=Pseudoneurospora amorphoporcata TaxID=241081 RepID=A0AAN6NYY4_9PEZI|nr:hypothetical protein QBC32DRAFT_338277 [Pseudoneurospora amorphoporcata]